MRFALLALLIPSLAFADGASLVRAMKRHDAKAIAAQLETPLAYDAWFPDAACAKRFPGGVLQTRDRAAFARCFVKLVPQLSTRTSSAPGGVVVTVEPGIELEVMIGDGRVKRIGLAGALDRSSTPMLTAQAFEALRTAGTTLLDDAVRAELESELGKSNPTSAWIRTCLDETGNATRDIATASTPKTGEVFLRATRDWAFRPFVLRKVPMRACSMSLLTFPSSKAPTIETLPRHGASRVAAYNFEDDLDLISQELPTIATLHATELEALALAPLDPKPATHAQLSVTAPDRVSKINVCISEKGDVRNVVVMGQNPGDRDRAKKIWRWKRFTPYVAKGVATSACALLSFVVTP